ncbi:MAG: hypothetical protein RIK87_24480 [Fuerstiella sp.]
MTRSVCHDSYSASRVDCRATYGRGRCGVSRAFVKLVLVAMLTSAAVRAAEPVRVTTIRDSQIGESSGLAGSYTHPNAIWIHNDSGDQPRLFLVNLSGETRAVVHLDGAQAVDWEDMCSFVIDGQPWLLVGDIGDNNRVRGRNQRPPCLYLLKEPVIPRSNGLPVIRWEVTASIRFTYEDGPWDCEAVGVDSERKEILLLTKSGPQHNGLFVLPLDLRRRKQQLTARRIASPFIPFATGLDISPSGRTMVVCTMLNGIAIFRQPGESWQDAFRKPGAPIDLPPRKQGETICFDRGGAWLYLNSEEAGQPLWKLAVPTAD